MAELVTIQQTDSTNDGAGASTTLEPPQVDNITDDAIIIKVTQSLNNATSVSNINVTTPTGYTLLTDLRDAELRSWVFWKRSTGSESIPTITSDTASRWTCTTAIVADVDWDNGGVNQHVQNTATGDTQSQDLTTSSSGNASAIVCLYSLERRACQGFRYPQTRPQTIYSGTATTGTAEGIDNTTGAGYDYIEERSTLWEGPFWEANGGGDSLAINVEVIVNKNIIPLQTSTLIKQAADSNSLNTNMNWCREIIDSGRGLDGDTLSTWNFNAATDIDTGNDTITLTSHGMDESIVVYLSDEGNTLPTGLTDDTFYYVFPQDANTIKLCSVNEDTDNTEDYYYEATTQRPIINITASGSGTVKITEARMINAGQNVLDILRPANGNSSNIGPYPGSYIGDAGYNQNFVCTAQRFNSVTDLSDKILTFRLQVNSQGRIDRVLVLFIDEDGDWVNFKIYKNNVSVRSTGQIDYQFQVGEQSVVNLAHAASGTFDATIVRYLAICAIGTNTSTARFGSVNSSTSVVQIGGPFTLINGQNSNFSDLVSLAQSYTDTINKPSDLQVTSTIPISFGDGTTKISFSDSEKSLAFPPLADGVSNFINYIGTLRCIINANSQSNVNITNSQIGASVPFAFDVIAVTGASVDLTGNSYVFGTSNLDSDISYNRQLFVGGEGIKDNGSEIINSTFITNSQIGAGNAMIDWDSNTDIESSTFELSSGTTSGHAIKIPSTGTYNFTNLSFDNFGLDNTDTSAIYNNSGGAVTIFINGGDTPSIKNSLGSTTTLTYPTDGIQFNNIIAGSQVVVFNTGTQTEVFRTNSSATSEFADIPPGTYDYTVMKIGLLPIRRTSIVVSQYLINTQGIQQSNDRTYQTSSGLSYNTTASLNTTSKEFEVTVNTTVQNWYSFWIESFISESALTNIQFPISTNGPNSFSLDFDYEFTSSSIQYLSRDGFRYVNISDSITSIYSAIQSLGTATGFTGEYQQVDGSGTTDAISTGPFDQVIQVFGDASHGNFNYANHLILKYQPNGYRQSRVNVVDTYGALEDQFYIVSMEPVLIPNFTTGNPGITGVTITNHGASPVSWDAGNGNKDYSITIEDSGTNTGEDILRWINYNLSLDATFEGEDPFNWPEMVIDNGTNYETIIGIVEGSLGATLKGVRVIRSGSNPHPDFLRFQADDGTYGIPPVTANVSITNIISGSRLRIYNENTSTEVINQIISGTSYSATYIEGTDYTTGDILTITLTKISSTTAKLPTSFGQVVSASGWSLLASQDDDLVYNTIGVDGSAITNFSADYVDDEVDVIVAANFNIGDWYAWWSYNLTTEQGIREFFGGATAIDQANFRINNTIVNLFFDNTTATNIYQLDNRRIFRSDGARPVKDPTTGGGGIDLVWKNTILIADITKIEDDLEVINNGVKKSSILVPHTTNL